MKVTEKFGTYTEICIFRIPAERRCFTIGYEQQGKKQNSSALASNSQMF
jgi:hypothetical protein